MNMSVFSFSVNIVTEEQLFKHLNECKNNFIPALQETVDISNYSKKIREHAITFEAWKDNKFKGCLAAYFNDKRSKRAYITNVSISEDCYGYGVASELVKMCIKYAKQKNFSEVRLHVNMRNNSALRLYKKFNFSFVKFLGDRIEMKYSVK